jgi:integration host factor subunit beta
VTKSQLIAAVAERSPHLAKKDIEASVNAIFEAMRAALCQDERIEVRGFGTFKVKRRPAREGRNPRNGERVFVPTRRIAVFSPGKEIRERLNGGPQAGRGGEGS